MTVTVTFNAEQAREIVRALGNRKALQGIQRTAVNRTGASARKRLKVSLAATLNTSAAAVRVGGKAARRPTSPTDAINYKLFNARAIPVSRLKASAKRHDKRTGRLKIKLPVGGNAEFAASRREGRGFRLLKAGPLAECFVGALGVRSRPFDAREGYAALIPERKRIERDLYDNMREALAEHFGRAAARTQRG